MAEAEIVWATTAALFLAGFAALLLRRQLLAMLLGLELMANAGNLVFVFTARRLSDGSGLAAVFLLLAIAACEAVVGLSLILALYRSRDAMETAEIRELHG